MLSTALALAIVTTVQAASPAPKWEVIAEPMTCHLRSINRAVDEQPFSFEIRPLAQTIELKLLKVKNINSREVDAVIKTGSQHTITAHYKPGSPTTGVKEAIAISRSDFDRLSSEESISITVRKHEFSNLSLRGIRRGLTAVGECASAILTRIGYVANEATPVPQGGFEEPTPVNFINNKDFAGGPIRKGGNGVAIIGWIVGRDGRVRNCTTLESLGNELLGVESCKLLTRRARYVPRTDGSGVPVEEYSYRRMVYRQ